MAKIYRFIRNEISNYRLALSQGKPQIYSSQVYSTIDKDGKENTYVPPMIDPDNVDKRRAAVGLGKLEGYLLFFGIEWDLEQYKKDLPELEKDFFKEK